MTVSAAALAQLRRDVAQLKAGREELAHVDRAKWDWFALSCPCNLPPGECREHARARLSQRFPKGDYRTELASCGRGWGKTRVGAELVLSRIRSGEWRRVALVGATADHVRDTMVEGESGLIAISPPWDRPTYNPSKRRLTWRNGAIAISHTADQPDRLRGPSWHGAWCDEVSSWRRPTAWDMLRLSIRLGKNPRRICTTTPKANRLIKEILADPSTVTIGGSTYDNALHLADDFIKDIRAKYEGSRLGRQEVYAEVLDITEAAWFGPIFDPRRHVSEAAEFDPNLPVRVAIDIGVSRHVGAVFYQVRQLDARRHRVNVVRDYYAVDQITEQNADAIRRIISEQFGRFDYPGKAERVRVDPAATARTGIGVAASSILKEVFGREFDYWPMHHVAEGLEHIELLLGSPDSEPGLIIHPRCERLIEAFNCYARQERGGEFLDVPVDPQHPHEDLLDALRGAIRDTFPSGFTLPTPFKRIPANRLF